MLFYNGDKQKWEDTHYNAFMRGNIPKGDPQLQNDFDGYCLDEKDKWSFYNRSELQFSENMNTSCSKIEEVCCQEINVTFDNSDIKFGNVSYYDEFQKEVFGSYKAFGMNEGRYFYQKNGLDNFLVYWNLPYYHGWVVNGYGKHRIHHSGGGVCPEHTKNKWKISMDGKKGHKKAPQIKITCIKKTADHSVKNKTTTATVTKTATAGTTTHTTATTAATTKTSTTTTKTTKTAKSTETTETTTATKTATAGTTTHTTATTTKPTATTTGDKATDETSHQANYSTAAIVFGISTFVLLLVMIIIFGKRFRRSWERGAQGKQLLWQTLDF